MGQFQVGYECAGEFVGFVIECVGGFWVLRRLCWIVEEKRKMNKV